MAAMKPGLHPGVGMAIMNEKSARSHPIDRISALTPGLGAGLLALLSALFSNIP